MKEIKDMSEDELIIYAIDVLQDYQKLPASAAFAMFKKRQQRYSERIKELEEILKNKRFFTGKYKQELNELQKAYELNEKDLDEYRGIFYKNDFKTFKAIMEMPLGKQKAPKETATTHTDESEKEFDDPEMY